MWLWSTGARSSRSEMAQLTLHRFASKSCTLRVTELNRSSPRAMCCRTTITCSGQQLGTYVKFASQKTTHSRSSTSHDSENEDHPRLSIVEPQHSVTLGALTQSRRSVIGAAVAMSCTWTCGVRPAHAIFGLGSREPEGMEQQQPRECPATSHMCATQRKRATVAET